MATNQQGKGVDAEDRPGIDDPNIHHASFLTSFTGPTYFSLALK